MSKKRKQPRWAIYDKRNKIITSRFSSKKRAERAISNLVDKGIKTRNLKVLSINHPLVKSYYKKVGRPRTRWY